MELLIVVAIIGMLAAMIFPTLGKARMRARTTKAIAELKTIELALMDYYTEYSGFPTNKTENGLYKLADEEYLDTALKDAFDSSEIYQYYSCNDTGDFADSCIVYSVGSDGENDDKDDDEITNFNEAHADAYPGWPTNLDQMPKSDNIYLILPVEDIRYKK